MILKDNSNIRMGSIDGITINLDDSICFRQKTGNDQKHGKWKWCGWG